MKNRAEEKFKISGLFKAFLRLFGRERKEKTSADTIGWGRKSVLVGTFRNKKQFEICKEKRFYYIPTSLVPESRLPITHIAAFQTPRVFGTDAGVKWVGKVKSAELLRRGEIREIPAANANHAGLYYYRFEISQWKELPSPILPREAAFVCDFTNLYLVKNARIIPELLFESEEEFLLYKETARLASLECDRSESISFNKGNLFSDSGDLRLIVGDKVCARCTAAEFSSRPTATFRRFYEASFKE